MVVVAEAKGQSIYFYEGYKPEVHKTYPPKNPPKKEIHPRPNTSSSSLKPTTCEEINMGVLPVYTKGKERK